MVNVEVNVLGTVYKLQLDTPEEDDDNLVENDGYIDYQTNTIVVSAFQEGVHGQTKDIQRYKDSVIRHELAHAFLYESGLANYSGDELLVDWMALQIPKMNRLFNELEINK